MLEIFATNITKTIRHNNFEKLLSLLPKKTQLSIKGFLKFEDAFRRLCSTLLIRSIICKKLNIPNADIEFDINRYDKPELKNTSGFHFNTAHSGEWAVCAIDKNPVGVDIELIKPIKFDIAENYFSREEYNDLMKKSGVDRLRYFYELWTLKESYLKAVGTGLSLPMDSFTIKPANDKITITTRNPYPYTCFRHYELAPDYTVAVCCKNNTFPSKIIITTLNDMLKCFLLQ